MGLRFLGPVIVCTVWPAVAGAQPALEVPPRPSLASVQARLRSDTPSEVAWGAFLAGQFQYKDAIPVIVERLQSPPAVDARQRHHLFAALLDSLIQLDGRVPAETLLPFFSDWQVHTLVLLGSATGNRDSALLSLMRGARGDTWLAIANFLLETKPAGLATQLLTGLRLTLSVNVMDVGDISSGSGMGAAGFAHGDGIGQLPDGFPPYAHYAFGRQRGAVILALGPTPVYYTRIVRNTFQYPAWVNSESGPTDWDRSRYIDALLQPIQVAPYASHGVSIRWTNERAFRSGVAQARAELVQLYEQLLGALIRSDRLTEAEARVLPPQIDVRVFDDRIDHSQPLPAIDISP